MKTRGWGELTISQYKKILKILERELDSDLEKKIACIAVVNDIDEDDVYSMKVPDMQRLLSDFEWLTTKYEFKPRNVGNTVKIGEEKYDINVDVNKFCVAQFLDYETLWDKREDPEYMGRLLSVFVVPRGKKYNDGYDIVELASHLEECITLDQWNNICFFFLKDSLLSIKASLLYSNWKLMKMIRREQSPEKKEELKTLQRKLLREIRRIR